VSQEKVADRSLSHFIIYFIIYCMHLESFTIKTQFCHSQLCPCTTPPKINRGLGRTDTSMLEDILDHHMTFYLQINYNKLNKYNYRKSYKYLTLHSTVLLCNQKRPDKPGFVQVQSILTKLYKLYKHKILERKKC